MANIFDIAKAKGVEDLEVYTGLSNSTSLKTFNGEVESYQISEQNVQSIRGLVNGKMGYAYTEDLNADPEELIDILIGNANVISSEDYEEIFAGSDSYPELPEESDGYTPKYDEIMQTLTELESSARAASEYVTDVNGTYSEQISKTTIENSKGLRLERDDHFFYIIGSVVCRKDEDTTNVWEVDLKKNFKDFDGREIGINGAKKAESQLGGAPCKSGNYKTILMNDAVNSILSVLGSLFYAEGVQKGLSPLKDKLNTQLVGENISLIDDPLLAEAISKSSFDDEGVRAAKTELIKDGKLVSYLYNLKSAHKDGVESTGNGFKQGAAGKVATSYTNLYIPKGEKSLDDLMAEVGDGILITEVSGTHAGINSFNGDFSLQSEGFLVKDGKQAEPVKLITIAGNIFEVLSNVESIGSDFKLSYYNVGSPSLVIKEMPVSGK